MLQLGGNGLDDASKKAVRAAWGYHGGELNL